MTVDLEASAKGLHFVSRGYALALGPGAMRLDHLAEGEHVFAVVLTLTHPWFGCVLRQTCLFRDTKDQNSSASRSRAMSIAHSP